jgi:hypothetical protein
MFELKKFLTNMSRASKEMDSVFSPGDASDGVEIEYEALVALQLRRLGIDRNCVAIDIRKIGETPRGHSVVVAALRLTNWERVSVLRILLGLPMLEARVHQAVAATWLSDVSHFAGVWLNASAELHESQGAGELRDLIMDLAPPRRLPRPDPDSGMGAELRREPVTHAFGSSGPNRHSIPHSQPARIR